MNVNKVRLAIILSGGLFLLLDQFLKWQATHAWTQPQLINPYLGWQLYLNPGVAFSLPLVNWLAIVLTIPMILFIAFLFAKSFSKNNLLEFAAWSLVLFGAISNLSDRIFYHHVIDYFLVATGIINIGDALIVAGLVLFLLGIRKRS